ncbi:ribonuclease H-like domain-containing protein [Tanacetum coccineum]
MQPNLGMLQSAIAKPHHVNAPNSSRNSKKELYSSNDMAHTYFLEEGRKKTQESNRIPIPRDMASARTHRTANSCTPNPMNISMCLHVSKSSCVPSNVVPLVDHSRNSSFFTESKHFVCSTYKKCIFNANHDNCITKFLKEVNSRTKVQSYKTRNNNKPVEPKCHTQKPSSQIVIGQMFSLNKSSAVHEKPHTPRSCLRWKPTGRISKTVGLRYVRIDKSDNLIEIKIPSPPLLPIPAPISSLPVLLPSTDHRADRPEFCLPSQKRLCSTQGPRYEVGESSSATAARPTGGRRENYGFVGTMDTEIRRQRAEEVGYEIRDVWVDPREAVDEAADHRSQTVTSEMLQADHMRRAEITALRTFDRTALAGTAGPSRGSTQPVATPERPGSVVASKPKTMQEATEMASELMDKKINTIAERQAENKRIAYTAGSGNKKQYGGSKPLCPKCNYNHNGPCAPKCYKCNKFGHLARNCRSSASVNPGSNQREYGQVRNANAPAKVYAVGHAETNPDSNVVTANLYMHVLEEKMHFRSLNDLVLTVSDFVRRDKVCTLRLECFLSMQLIQKLRDDEKRMKKAFEDVSGSFEQKSNQDRDHRSFPFSLYFLSLEPWFIIYGLINQDPPNKVVLYRVTPIYVDDIILINSSTTLLRQIISYLHSEFDMTDLEELNYFLGISAVCHSTGLFLSQRQYVSKLLERAHMTNYNPSWTPVDTQSKLGPEGVLVQDPTIYRSLAGGLQYLMFTRPSLSYAVHQVCLYIYDPREPHFVALKRILRYVHGTMDFGLHLYTSSTTSLVGYTDVDSASFPLQDGLHLVTVFFWATIYCHGHPSVITPSLDLVPKLNIGVLLTMWLRLHGSAICFLSYTLLCPLPFLVTAGQVRVLHVPSRYQHADIFTKELPAALFEEFRSSLSV